MPLSRPLTLDSAQLHRGAMHINEVTALRADRHVPVVPRSCCWSCRRYCCSMRRRCCCCS